MTSSKPITIAIVAGEASGDALGADLIRSLRHYFPQAQFVGIAGNKMLAEGCQTLAPMETLSVMGVTEVLRHLPALLSLRRRIIKHFIANPPDVFIGIDAPDFNLTVESHLKKAGIRTVHYVSPSVWAWRKGRIKKIKRSVDLLLTLFPFENAFYEEHHVPVKFVGHPLADRIPLDNPKEEARRILDLPLEKNIIALLPGSRGQEIHLLAPVFFETAMLCLQQKPDALFVIAASSEQRYQQLSELLKQYPALQNKMTLTRESAQNVMTASDVVLAASGTVTLEAMLVGRPMVVAYRMAPITWWLADRFVDSPFCAIPNLLAKHMMVPEFLQDEGSPTALARAVLEWMNHPEYVAELQKQYRYIHLMLKQDASEQAAQSIARLLKD